MTRRQLEGDLERLRRLLIPEWRIILSKNLPPDHDGDCHAVVQCRDDYEEAVVHFTDECLKRDRASVLTTVVHELLHVVLRDTRAIRDRIEGQLHRDVQAVITEQADHEEERLVERLSRVIAHLYTAETAANDRPLLPGTSRHLDC